MGRSGGPQKCTVSVFAIDLGTGTTAVAPGSRGDDDDFAGADSEKRKIGDVSGVAGDGAVQKLPKTTMGFSRTFGSIKPMEEKKAAVAPISIKLGAQKTKESAPVMKAASMSVAEAFNQSSDEEEEMPPEAKMRMRNIGRDTPTSAGPNSFGKTRKGFCDVKKVFERDLKSKLDDTSE
ncbi:unnamed protein product [Ixodes hexagonus]